MNFLTVLLSALFFISAPCLMAQNMADPDPHRFDKEITSFKNWDQKNSFAKDAILFVGSSSTRLWMTQDAFSDYNVINRGFGGAHISDMLFFMQETVLKYNAPVIVFYCGDNDIAAGKSAERVLSDYQKFVTRASESNPGVKILFIPIKPSINRWSFWPEMQRANRLIAEYSATTANLYYVDTATPMIPDGQMPAADLFIEDGLHLSEKGYALWNDILRPVLAELKPLQLNAPNKMKMIK